MPINTTGKYYLRVDDYKGDYVNYNLVVKVNNSTVLTDDNSAYGISSQGLAVRLFSTENACRAKLYYSGPAYPIAIYAPGDLAGNKSETYLVAAGTSWYEFNLPSSGTWAIVIRHGIQQTTTLTPFFL